MRLKYVPKIVLTCAALHNFLIDSSDEWCSDLEVLPMVSGHGNPRRGIISHENVHERRRGRRDREKSKRRSEMTRKLRAAGRLRPATVSRVLW